MRVPRANGHRYRRARRAVLAESDVCWWCAHPGADQADHLIPRSVDPTIDVADPANLGPIHGTRPCATCGRRCNQERGNDMTARPAEQVHSRRW